MRKVKLSSLRNALFTTKCASQGASSNFYPIIVLGGQTIDGVHFPDNEIVETSPRAIKMDGPALTAGRFLEPEFKRTNYTESVVMRLGLCYLAAKRGCTDKFVLECAEWFEEIIAGE